MNEIVLATFSTAIIGSFLIDPSACVEPADAYAAMLVAALPMSICVAVMLYLRPSSEVERVRPVMACLETV